MSDDTRRSSCLAPETLGAYFAGTLTDAEENRVEEHLAGCEACTGDARAFHELQAVWDTWTPRAHGEAFWRGRLAGALEVAERADVSPLWRERLSRWQARLASSAERIAGIVTLLQPGGPWQLAPALGAIRTRGAVGGAPVTRGAPDPVSDPVTDVWAERGRPARIEVGAEGREVVVRISGEERPLPLVLLVPSSEGALPRVAEPQRHGEAGEWVARFGDLEPGVYLVVLEPPG